MRVTRIPRAVPLTLKWLFWAEILGPVFIAIVAIPLGIVWEPARDRLAFPSVVVGAVVFAGWGVMMFFLCLPSLIVSAIILASVSRLNPSIESSAILSTCIVSVIGLAAYGPPSAPRLPST